MFELNDNIVRKNILNLKPYTSARDEYSGNDGVFLDANENPFGELNRYPDPYQKKLKKKLSEMKSVPSENIFIGNGSDEVIDLTFRIFCNPGKDKALTFSPGYGMYDVSAQINDIKLIKVLLNKSFQIDFDVAEKYLNDKALKLILVCSPNNPTGNIIDNIELLLQKFKGIVVIDEAYIDFSKTISFITIIQEFPNLIVSQTFSKAWGLAASRVGTAYASTRVISLFNKVKPPYNVSGLNQKAVLKALKNYSEFEKRKSIILEQKSWLEKQLQGIPTVKKIYHSDANFILVEVTDADNVYNKLIRKKVIIRNRNLLVKNCIRITVGTPEENKKLIKELSEL